MKQLVMPTQVQLDLPHPCITQQFPQAVWVASCLEVAQGKAVAQELWTD